MSFLRHLFVFIFAILFSISYSQTVIDIDGNTYKTIEIGSQFWFAENLKVTHFSDGSEIPLVIEKEEWDSLITPGYCLYNNNDSLYKNIYGALYNWYAVSNNKLCPLGWHVPSNTEWDTLISFLEGNYLAGGRMKDIGTKFWKNPNTGGTNESGFTALPGGFRTSDNGFSNLSISGYFWTSTEYKEEKACSRILIYYSTNIFKDHNNKQNGYSVRCIKD